MAKKNVMVLLVLIHCFVACLAVSLTNFTDESSLLAFKAQISSDNILANNWSEGTSFCNWVGVSCSRRHQRVTALNLPNMGLKGTIPREIGNLSFLIYFDISNNSFHGHLPHELGLLRRLKSLNLQDNVLSGVIPTSFGFLTKLQGLDLSFNSFTGSIPREIGYLPNLLRLSINFNNISGFIPPILFNISSLQIISLGGNRLSGTLPVDMCNNLPKLEGLSLSRNQLSGQLPTSLHQCTQLRQLSLSFNEFTGSIHGGIGNLSKLQMIHLGRNHLTGTIPPSFGNLSMLEILNIPSNNIHNNIPQELGQLMNLKNLGMDSNNLMGEIPQSIFNISRVHSITLAANKFSGNLPSSIGLWLPNLDSLLLGGNEFSGIIPNSISNASKLTRIDLGGNFFNGNVPTTLGNLRHLQFLSIQLNQLTNDPSTLELGIIDPLTNCRHLKTLIIGPNPLNGILPKSMGNLSIFLETFYAPDCQLKGLIPSEIGNLSSLIRLDLRGNNFTGSIPMTMGQLRKIQHLELSGSAIKGSIPSDLCNLTKLSELALRKNKLSRSIPSCLGNLTSLRRLYLDSNELTSKIPSTMWSLEDVMVLDLSSNVLIGSLPPEIGNLKHIIQLDLSKNEFTGEIPSTIGGLPSLQSLNLCQNILQGPIPQSISDSISLKSLDLSQNNLSGVIPNSLVKLLYLEYINVSFNRLSGEIPIEGPFSNFTAESFMQNSALCGAPQFHVRECNSRQHSGKTRILLKYIVPSVASVVIAAAFIIWLLRCRGKNTEVPIQADSPIGLTHRRISYHEILRATSNFTEDHLIGRGSLSLVYKGIFSDGMIFAIKVFNLELQGAFKSFEAECEVMRNIRHRNLVKIISSCSNLDFKALVLEYMPNGNLEKWLYSHNYCLDIVQRLGVMIDVASALEYLHHGYSTLVVHCDLKPSNILLDGDMIAHVGDFGIAKLLTENESVTQTKTLGTIGYMAPEYGSAGRVSPMGDVYSFGILLMETFTRKKPTDDLFLGEGSLKRWVYESFPSPIMEVVDANLLKIEEENFSAVQNCLLSLLGLALECTADLPEERINMKDVLVKLKKIKITFHENVMGC